MRHRLAIILPIYLLVYSACYIGAFLLRFDFSIPNQFQAVFWTTLPTIFAIKYIVCTFTGEWQRTFRYATISDAIALTISVLLSGTLIAVINSLNLFPVAIPRSIIIIDMILSFLVLGALRAGMRVRSEVSLARRNRHSQEKTLVYGVDQNAISIQRMLAAIHHHEYRVTGFIDPRDHQNKQNSLIAGLKVFSLCKGWKKIAAMTEAKHLLVPGEVAGKLAREILQQCKDVGVKVHVIPTVNELVDGKYKLTVRDLTVSDLLRREPNQLDMDSIKDYVTGKRVLITGAAGSIGSELSRQLRELKPKSLILLDQSEIGIFTMEREFAQLEDPETEIHYVMADIADEPTIERVMNDLQPQIIFHAAAYKHVPLMESNPQAAVLNNVFGTKNIVDLSVRHHVERFVMVSTDKAVRPTSVMGATKLIAEKYVQSTSQHADTKFITVRFGNVLNSVGSVVPTFRKQIETGGPITITHPDMERFFMTIPEAVQLVIQAGAVGSTGDVLILDMGEPVKILDLAKDIILLSGLNYPEDIDIVFSGIRPGEKLYEELFYSSETGAKKVHNKIYSGTADIIPQKTEILATLKQLEEAAYQTNREAINALRDTVAKYADQEWIPANFGKAA